MAIPWQNPVVCSPLIGRGYFLETADPNEIKLGRCTYSIGQMNLWSCSSKPLPFTDLWLVPGFLHISNLLTRLMVNFIGSLIVIFPGRNLHFHVYRQTTDMFEDGSPQSWLTSGHTLLNHIHFPTYDWSSSFCAFALKPLMSDIFVWHFKGSLVFRDVELHELIRFNQTRLIFYILKCGIPRDWWTFCHTPLNSCRFLASGRSSSFCALTKLSLDWPHN